MDKTTAIRNRLLAEIGSVPDGARIVSARKLAPEFGVSFQFVQRVVDDLADRGVISVLPRSGMTAHPQWRNRILNGVFRIFESALQKDDFCTLCAEKMPEIFVSDKFKSSTSRLMSSLTRMPVAYRSSSIA